MSALLVGVWLLGATGETGVVYHYRDAHGIDHYVNHREQVPKGAKADSVQLTEDLNPGLAREMEENAHRAAEEAKAKAEEAARVRAAEEAARASSDSPALPAPATAPPEARPLLIWAIACSLVFLGLWLARGPLLMRSPPLALAFQPVRWGTGIGALLGWFLLAFVARGWIVDRFPPFQAISRTRANVDKINREQKEAEHELDKALGGH